jgi:hypothetical protein
MEYRMKTCLCDSCRFSEIRTQEIMKPKYKFSDEYIKTTQLTVYCHQEGNFKHKIITNKNRTCEYRPKAGVIGKKLFQATL